MKERIAYIVIIIVCAIAALYGFNLQHGSAHNIAASMFGWLMILAAAVVALITSIVCAMRR